MRMVGRAGFVAKWSRKCAGELARIIKRRPASADFLALFATEQSLLIPYASHPAKD